MTPPRLLTLEEVADVLRCSRSTVERRIAAGILTAVRIPQSRLVLVDEDDLRRLVLAAKHRASGAPPRELTGVVMKPGARLWDR